MMPAPPPPSNSSIHPARWCPTGIGGSRATTDFHDPGSSPIAYSDLDLAVRQPSPTRSVSPATSSYRDDRQFLPPRRTLKSP
jgi:hypothetical protein